MKSKFTDILSERDLQELQVSSRKCGIVFFIFVKLTFTDSIFSDTHYVAKKWYKNWNFKVEFLLNSCLSQDQKIFWLLMELPTCSQVHLCLTSMQASIAQERACGFSPWRWKANSKRLSPWLEVIFFISV
jgi:hypothetical protein